MSGTGTALRGRRILVLEDEYMIADEVTEALGKAGAEVVGPVATLEGALSTIASGGGLNGAVLDVNLGGKMSFGAADKLMEVNVPFIFTTGYDASAIPARFERVARCEKPVSIAKVVRAIGQAMHP